MTNEWLPNPGTGDNPVREGEKLVALRFQYGHEHIPVCSADKWEWKAGDITHFKVSPPRTATPTAEPATMSADEVLIRAREALIAVSSPASEDIKLFRHGGVDEYDTIQAIIAYERDRAKPLAEVAPHTVEDPDDREAYDLYAEQCGINLHPWEDRHASSWYRSLRVAIKRGRELERGA
jgi:hypothetical protein